MLKSIKGTAAGIRLFALSTALLFSGQARATGYTILGNPITQGAILQFQAGPGESGEIDTLYMGFASPKSGFLLLQIDPKTAKAKQYQAEPPFSDVWGMTPGNDGILYMASQGHLFKFDPKQNEKGIEYISETIPGEKLIWRLVTAPNGIIYGVTYPGTYLVSYNPESGEIVDHGKLDPVEKYARPLFVGKDGWLYAGIGTDRNQIVAFDPETETKRYLLEESDRPRGPGPGSGWGLLVNDADGTVFARIGEKNYRMENGVGTEISEDIVPKRAFRRPLKDGRTPARAKPDGFYWLHDNWTDSLERYKFTYEAQPPIIFAVGATKQAAYAGTFLPLVMIESSWIDGQPLTRELGSPPGALGEAYSIAGHGNVVYVGAYPGGDITRYDPTEPWDPGVNPKLLASLPRGAHRPIALDTDAQERVYVGGVADYGQQEGSIYVMVGRTGKILASHHSLIPGQGIRCLLPDNDSGYLYGGSTNAVGNGVKPVDQPAVIFSIDPLSGEVIWKTPVPSGDRHVISMVLKEGRLLALTAEKHSEFGPKDGAKHLLALDPKTGDVLKEVSFSAGIPWDGSLAVHGETIYGVSTEGVFTVDAKSLDVVLLEPSPRPASTGLAVNDDGVYFGAGRILMFYRPETSEEPSVEPPSEEPPPSP